MGVNSLPKTVTRQRRGCNSNPGPSARESSTLTTRLLLLLLVTTNNYPYYNSQHPLLYYPLVLQYTFFFVRLLTLVVPFCNI